jgi:serine protease Do
MTNNHVIDGGTNIKVELTDGTIKNATIVASDKNTDIGVITIPKIGIDSAKYKTVIIPSDSYEVRVGDTAIAIGNSLGKLGGTVTAGIVSAFDRDVTIGEVSMKLMQTDAALNQGNSGGGLFDSYGQLIGVVNSKIVNTGIEGLGFAVPVKIALSTACDLITKGYVSGRPMIGVTIREVNSKAKRENFLQTLEGEELTKWQGYFSASNNALGLYVAEVTNVASGLKEGDYLVSFEGKSVIIQDDLSNLLLKQKAGDVVSIVVKRNGTIISLNVELLDRISVE